MNLVSFAISVNYILNSAYLAVYNIYMGCGTSRTKFTDIEFKSEQNARHMMKNQLIADDLQEALDLFGIVKGRNVEIIGNGKRRFS